MHAAEHTVKHNYPFAFFKFFFYMNQVLLHVRQPERTRIIQVLPEASVVEPHQRSCLSRVWLV